MQTCQVCGKQNPPGVEYCEDCGATLTSASSAPAPGQAPVGPQDANQPETLAPAAEGAVEAVAGDPATPQAVDGPSSPSASPAPAAASAGAGPPLPQADAPTPPAAGTADAPGAAAAPGAPAGPGAAPAAAGRPRLVVKRHGALTGEEIPLLAERLLVGRFDQETGPVDIDLSGAPEAEQISRQHGELYREADGRWLVRDLGSTNGVFVKGGSDSSFGPRITAPRALSDGDELAFGNARFVFQSD